MPGHRHSSSRGICYARSPSLRLAPAILFDSPPLVQFGRTGRNFAGGRCRWPCHSVVSIDRAYGCGTIGYLLLCIWHIVKLIERGDKIAMFFDVKRDERIAKERRTAVAEKKRERERDKGEKAAGERRSNSRQTERKREIEGESERESHACRGEERRALSGAASSPRRCL